MPERYISSTHAQNNFGQVLDGVTREHVRYIITRRGTAQAVVLSFDDFMRLLDDEADRGQLRRVLHEIRPTYGLGEPLTPLEPTPLAE